MSAANRGDFGREFVHLNMLITDWLVWFFLAIAIAFFIYAATQPHWREPWQRLLKNRIATISIVILGFYFVLGLLDCVHFMQGSQLVSLLDLILKPLQHGDEKTYSAPFSLNLYSINDPQRLKYATSHLIDISQRPADIFKHVVIGFFEGLISGLFIIVLLTALLSFIKKYSAKHSLSKLIRGKTINAWRPAVLVFLFIWVIIFICGNLAAYYHVLGTDKVGYDVLYQAVKSIRTGLLIGTLTTIFMLPLAIILGLAAGYFSGWPDDVIQYLYTTLSSIPGVLLISASVLVMQIYIAGHPELFPSIAERADARLLALCFILGITSWASLCRLLRAETLKLRELEYIQAAQVLGVSRFAILWRHLLPNVLHIILITIVLDFSGLVLAEAVLSYVGVGVDPTTLSWGNMINSSRLELAREPIVWWPLCAALVFMFGLVLSANLLSDALRDALDPRLKD